MDNLAYWCGLAEAFALELVCSRFLIPYSA